MTVTFEATSDRRAILALLEGPVRKLLPAILRADESTWADAEDIQAILAEVDRTDAVTAASRRNAFDNQTVLTEAKAAILANAVPATGQDCGAGYRGRRECSRRAATVLADIGPRCRQHANIEAGKLAEDRVKTATMARWRNGEWTPDEALLNDHRDIMDERRYAARAAREAASEPGSATR